jgi:hypothetical protein
MTPLAIAFAVLAFLFAVAGQHAQRSVGGRDFYIAALVCALIALGAAKFGGLN